MPRIFLCLFGFALFVAGCDRTSPKAVLMVTWLLPGHPPETTQISMRDMGTCEAAREKAVAAGEAARAERIRLNEQEKAEAIAATQAEIAQLPPGAKLTGVGPEAERKLRGEPLPQVSAFCVQQ